MRRCFILILLTFMQINLYSQVPNTLSWQGILQDNNGANLDGQFNITTKLFDVSSGGTALWIETQNNVQISDGLANLTLGEITPLTISFNNQLWLEVQVGAGTPLPRIKLTSVPYALSALSSNEYDPTWNGSNDTTGNIYRNGNVGIGTATPSALLHTSGTGIGAGNVLFEGEFKDTDPGNPPVSGEGTRMMWYPDKAAFRAGYVDGAHWDNDSIGDFSVAMGNNSKALSSHALAIGYENISSGSASTAIGQNNTAMSFSSIAIGYENIASGFVSTAIGWNNKASGYSSTAIGSSLLSSGDYSTALGSSTIASGALSTALGASTKAIGPYSTAFGIGTTASGKRSTVFGSNTTAKSGFETVIGRWNTDYTPIDTSDWNISDRLFVIGNGTSSNARSNALTVLKNGRLGLGTDIPDALLHTNGIGIGGGNVLFTGEYKSTNQGNPPATGGGTRMMWYPDKAAFRVGMVEFNNWNKDSIGNYSIALGHNPKALGTASIALGFSSTASGIYSKAMGYMATASGGYSTAMGYFTNASGANSTVLGLNNTAKSFVETVVGSFNTDYSHGGTSAWVSTDRLFVIGNGTASNSRSNAMTVLKNGRVGLQTVTSPTYALELPNTTTIGIGRGRANDWVLYSDGRLKTNRTEITYGLYEIMKLEPLKYFHHNSITENGVINISNEGANDIGFIAQDLFKILPEIVSPPENEASDLWSVSYSKLTPVLVKAIQEQQSIIDNQNQRIEELERKLEILLNKIGN
ncbi:MAG: tail fiber domain-containing protein [Ignavibacteriae bacterium]|nr:tail fiber domain-containing protein [Ignavibacteriota bacterium]